MCVCVYIYTFYSIMRKASIPSSYNNELFDCVKNNKIVEKFHRVKFEEIYSTLYQPKLDIIKKTFFFHSLG